jgi:hypothetical protein
MRIWPLNIAEAGSAFGLYVYARKVGAESSFRTSAFFTIQLIGRGLRAVAKADEGRRRRPQALSDRDEDGLETLFSFAITPGLPSHGPE